MCALSDELNNTGKSAERQAAVKCMHDIHACATVLVSYTCMHVRLIIVLQWFPTDIREPITAGHLTVKLITQSKKNNVTIYDIMVTPTTHNEAAEIYANMAEQNKGVRTRDVVSSRLLYKSFMLFLVHV